MNWPTLSLAQSHANSNASEGTVVFITRETNVTEHILGESVVVKGRGAGSYNYKKSLSNGDFQVFLAILHRFSSSTRGLSLWALVTSSISSPRLLQTFTKTIQFDAGNGDSYSKSSRYMSDSVRETGWYQI